MATGLGLDFKRVNAKSFDVDFQLTSAQRSAYISDPVRVAGQFCADPDTGEMFVLNSDLDEWLPVGGNIVEHNSANIYTAGKVVSVTSGDTFTLHIAKIDVPALTAIGNTTYWKSGGGAGTPGADGPEGKGYANTVVPGAAESISGPTFTFTLGDIDLSAYLVGSYVLLSGSVDPELNYIIGTITNIAGSVITVTSDVIANDAGNATTDDSGWTISITGRKGVDGLDGTDGVDGANAYTYIAYASDGGGTGFTNTFNAALDYVAIKSTTTPLSPPIASDFTGLWKNYKGATGAAGADSTVPGPAGTNGANADMTRLGTAASTNGTVGTGAKTMTYTSTSNLGWMVGTRLRASLIAAPTTTWMEGVVTAVSSTSVTFTSDTTLGSGTYNASNAWDLVIVGQPGRAGSDFITLSTPGATSNNLTITPVSATELAPNFEITLSSTSGSTNTVPHAFQIAFGSTLPSGAAGLLRVYNNDTTNVKVLTIPAGDKLLNGATVSQSTISCQPNNRYTDIAYKKSPLATLWYYVD